MEIAEGCLGLLVEKLMKRYQPLPEWHVRVRNGQAFLNVRVLCGDSEVEFAGTDLELLIGRLESLKARKKHFEERLLEVRANLKG